MKMHKFVSVIIPLYNDETKIEKTIMALLEQDYPEEFIEILVIDNGSSDNSKQAALKHPVIVLTENRIKGSYAARNRGIEKAKGEIIGFIDSDCIPERNWAKEGVKALENADLSSGKVEFIFSERGSDSEMFDAINHLDFTGRLPDEGSAGTCNLFVKRDVFKRTNVFPSRLKSGGDFIFTKRAVNHGFKLVYNPLQVVYHPARGLIALMKKGIRTGGGVIAKRKEEGKSFSNIFFIVLGFFLPPLPVRIKSKIKSRGAPEMERHFFGIWLTAYLSRLCNAAGIILSLFNIRKRR